MPEERIAAFRAGRRPSMERMLRHEVPWIGCQYPTPALAQEAGMSTDAFADFLFGACLIDWAELAERLQRRADHFDQAEEVRIVGEGTDLGSRWPAADARLIARRQPPRWRVLRLPGRGLDRRRDRLHRVPGPVLGSRAEPDRLRFEAARSSTRAPTRTRTSCSRRWTPTKGRGGSASSGSAATRASRAT